MHSDSTQLTLDMTTTELPVHYNMDKAVHRRAGKVAARY